MLEELDESQGPDLERLCQGVSPNDEPCDYPATVHCPICRQRWFCDTHAELTKLGIRACSILETKAGRKLTPR